MSDKEKSAEKKEKKQKTAMEVAAAYLANRMRTVAEMRQHLRDKEYSDSEINECVNDLIGLKYLDDYAYALRYYEYNSSKHRGSKRAMRELEEKGVDKQTINFALEDYKYESGIDEYTMALEIARKEVFITSDECGPGADIDKIEMKEVDDKLVAKVARKLESRGFANDDIYRVMSEMRRWDKEEYN